MKQEEHLNVAAQVYVATVISAGLMAVAASIYALYLAPVSLHWLLLAGLTLLSGSFTIRIPTIPARLSVSETFVFAAVLMFGPAAATMIVVLDSLIISLWLGRRSQRPSRVLFNMAAPSLAIWIASHSFYFLAAIEPLWHSPRPILPLLGPLVVLALVYFLLNSILIAFAVAFEKGISAFAVWRDNFLWLSLNYFSGASVAALLLPYLQPEKPEFARVIGILLPLLLISYLTFKTAMGRVDDANRHLSELNRLYLSTIETLAMAIDAKDQITHGHIRRVQLQAVRLAKAMGVTGEAQIQAIEAAALLHDMGKLAVPEYILNKPGPLTPAEFEKMKLHASVGGDILSAIDFPYPVVPIVRHHHENWDGTGYPDRLSGAAIPIGARILSVVDCFDALTSDRPYRPRLSDKDALRIVTQRRGTMYDPLVVDTFLEVHAQGEMQIHQPTPILPLGRVGGLQASTNDPSSPPPRPLEDITSSGEEMLALYELARGLSGPMTPVEATDVVLKHLRRIVPSSLSALYINDVDADELVCSYVLGEHTGVITGLRIPLGQRLTGWVGANRQTIRNSDPVLDLGESARSMVPRPRSCLSTPVVVGDVLIGVLSVYSSTRDAFSEEHQRIIEVVARQVGPVVQQALLSTEKTGGVVVTGNHTLKDANGLALAVDQLTSLPGLEQLQLFVPLGAASLSLIYVEVNGLELINTSYGRQVGRDALSHVVACIRRHIRGADTVFRLNADDFVVVLFDADKVLAAAVAARIRQQIESQAIGTSVRLYVRVTVGVAASPDDGKGVETLISAARLRTRRSADDFGHSPGAVH
jgi:diguanylate cyclase (GGDEF)-like protein/putative nucleotidyltransferase with HDIG domain